MAPNNFLQLYFGILSSPAYGKTIEYYSPSSMFLSLMVYCSFKAVNINLAMHTQICEKLD